MDKFIKRLQKLLSEGKIDLQEYQAQLQELLDDETINQELYDAAKDFKPESKDDEPIYTQSDVDRMIMVKARKMVKKALTDAGVDTDNIDNKDLLTTFGDLALQGQKKGSLSVDEAQLNELQKKAKAYDTLQPQLKGLTIENEVLKAAGVYNPVNPKQVVRALDDYKDLLEYDEDDVLVPKSVERALKKLSEAEPNLFTAVDGADDEDDKGGQAGGEGFRGKTPGGGAGGTDQNKKHDKTKAEALAMMGIKKD
ncbi:hypothetical protein [Lysinibacillus sp. 54212]|uniref:hypothetical protein n=1 Tax=Lysinibacillus sp. 54212 TaxID=3119829 RepID=UPI002FCCA7FD